MRSLRTALASVVIAALLSVGFAAVAPPASAALPSGPASVGLTGDRPGATEVPFWLADQVRASVDVGTGNLRVQLSTFSLPGVNGEVGLTQSYNSLGFTNGTPSVSRWTLGVQGVGHLTSGGSGSVIYTGGDGATWKFTPVSGTPGAYTSPSGVKADLSSSASTFTLRFRESATVVTFNDDGRATAIADRNGNTTAVGYLPSGNPNTITSTAGPTAARLLTLTLNAATLTYTATQSSGGSSRSVQFVSNTSAELVKYVDATGKQTTFAYTGGLLTSITAPGGAVTTIGYVSGTGKVASVSQANITAGSPGTSVTRFAYPSATQTQVAQPNTNQSAGVSAVPRITYTIVNATRLVSGATDEMGRAQGATYTPNGDVATSTTGTGSSASTSTNTYGANGGDSRTSAESAPGHTSTTEYANTAAGTAYLPSSGTDARGNVSTYTYNGAGNPSSSTNALAATASVVHNSRGQVTSATAPGNGTNRTNYGYNSTFQMSSITPVTGSSLQPRSMTYDSYGRLATETDGRGVTITYTYDNNDRLLSTAFSDGTPTVTNTYNDAGQIKTRVDANGTTTWNYDQLGRLISRSNSFAGGTISYGYDRSSNLTSVTDGRGTTTNTFDASNTLTKITYPSGSGTKDVVFVTDDQGRRTHTYLNPNASLTAWIGHVEQQYGRGDRVTRVIAQTVNGSGTVQTVSDVSYCYNTAGTAPTCSTNRATDTDKMRWERDNVSGQVTTYGYDNAGRLTSATQTGGTAPTTFTFTYDSRGNRLTATTTGGSSTSQTVNHNAANQVTNNGWSYDGAGNVLTNRSRTYDYNGARQMTTITQASGTSTYKYAGVGQTELLQQQTPSTTYRLVYGRDNQYGLPVVEQSRVGNHIAYIDNDPVTGQPLLLRTSTGTVSLYVYSGTGNPTGILRDITGTGYTYTYDPYGAPNLESDSGGSGNQQNPFMFQGGIEDKTTGWVKFGDRWYDINVGKWTQQDTLDAPLDPTNANRYAYAGADPINNADPTGLVTAAQCQLAGSAVLAIRTSTLNFAGAAVGLFVGGPAGLAVGAGISLYAGTTTLILDYVIDNSCEEKYS